MHRPDGRFDLEAASDNAAGMAGLLHDPELEMSHSDRGSTAIHFAPWPTPARDIDRHPDALTAAKEFMTLTLAKTLHLAAARHAKLPRIVECALIGENETWNGICLRRDLDAQAMCFDLGAARNGEQAFAIVLAADLSKDDTPEQLYSKIEPYGPQARRECPWLDDVIAGVPQQLPLWRWIEHNAIHEFCHAMTWPYAGHADPWLREFRAATIAGGATRRDLARDAAPINFDELLKGPA